MEIEFPVRQPEVVEKARTKAAKQDLKKMTFGCHIRTNARNPAAAGKKERNKKDGPKNEWNEENEEEPVDERFAMRRTNDEKPGTGGNTR